jgi:uncharacterized protein (TIGR02147 family)
MKSIFHFSDYRAYLAHYYQEQKRTTRYFSYRYFAGKAGINSSSFLKHVIDGRRNLTPATIDKFSAALSLSPRESRYFRHLVFFTQAETAREKQEHYTALRSLAGRVSEAVLKKDQYEYFATWHTPVIRELICLFDFADDWGRLGRAVAPPITAGEARAAVRLLLKLGLVERDAEGRYRQTSRAVAADDSITTLGLRRFLQTMVRQAESALDRYPNTRRHISGVTMGISRSAYTALAAEIEAFKDRVKAIVDRDEASDQVYQFNLALFPVSDRMPQQAAGDEE